MCDAQVLQSKQLQSNGQRLVVFNGRHIHSFRYQFVRVSFLSDLLKCRTFHIQCVECTCTFQSSRVDIDGCNLFEPDCSDGFVRTNIIIMNSFVLLAVLPVFYV